MEPLPVELIDRLSALYGIGTEYWDNWGQRHVTSTESKLAILTAMGVEISEAQVHRKLNEWWLRFIDPVLVVSVSCQPSTIPLRFPLEEGRESEVELAIIIHDEAGHEALIEASGLNVTDATFIDGTRYVKAEIDNRADRELGYYDITVEAKTPSADYSGRMRLIVTPDRCHEAHGHTWGVYANLYALRSAHNWGAGDLADLGAMVRWTAQELGGDFVGINPLHSIANEMPLGISPYGSKSRLYTNFIYIDLDRIEATPRYRALVESPEFVIEMDALRRTELIDYEGVAALKLRALKVAYEEFYERHLTAGTPEAENFERYVEAEGQSLEGFAAFLAIEEHVRAKHPDVKHWRDWPEKFRDHKSPGVREFIRTHEKEFVFHQYVQWLADGQLREVLDEARSLGMGVGLYQDLAVGSAGAGPDAWTYPEVFARGMEAGAPPDAFNINGQAWGFPPLIPDRLRDTGYELFIRTIRNNMRYSGALRIDHVLGMFRLFWVPKGLGAKEGAYVSYPSEDLMRIIALESVRNETVVIGEDLGTVGDDVREALPRFGMLSYRLFYFERDWNNGATILPPERYPEAALTAVTTHDLPTLSGYWSGHDIEVKKEIGIYPDEESLKRDIDERERDRGFIIDALGYCLPEGYERPADMTPELSVCIHRHLARTPCRMVVVSLDDVLGVLNQQNMPGTVKEHPNWRQKCPVMLSNVMQNKQARALSEMFREEGRGQSR